MATHEGIEGHNLPSGFGVSRTEGIGLATHDLIYEHVYFPAPIRKYSAEKPAVCSGTLRPAIRNGKVAFKFYGCRVPMTADHARCWLGHVLLAEARLGRLDFVELVVRAEHNPFLPPMPVVESGGPMSMCHNGGHGGLRQSLLPTWLWHVWPEKACKEAYKRPQPVEVWMTISPEAGVAIDLRHRNAQQVAHVHRVLRQYCDDDCAASEWCPRPDRAAHNSRISSREIPPDVQRRRIANLPVPETGNQFAAKTLQRYTDAEIVMLQALSRLEATRESASMDDCLLYTGEAVKRTLGAADAGVPMKQERLDLVTRGMEAMLHRFEGDAEYPEFQAKIARMASDAQPVGMRPPVAMKAGGKQVFS